MTRDEAGAVRALLLVDSAIDVEQPGRFAQDLLDTLVAATGAGAARILVDRADGRGPVIMAGTGPQAALDFPSERFALTACRPWFGEIVIAGAFTAWDQTLGHLAADRLGHALEIERLREADLRRQDWLTFLAECSELLAQSLDLKLTTALIPRLMVPRLGEWCAIYLADSSGELFLEGAAHTDESKITGLLSLLDNEALSLRWQDVLRTNTSTVLAAPLDGMAVPLIARGQRLGTLAVGRNPAQRSDPDEVSIAEDVARRGALALDNARTHEERRRVAQTLQAALLPPTLPEIKGLSLSAEYVSAADGVDVGGDFYDVIALDDGRCVFMVGDVSGKGVQAATVTGLVRDIFRVLVRDGRSLPSILSTLNDTLFERRERHCTLALAAFEPCHGSGPREVTLYLAGHDRPLLVSAAGEVTTVGAWGTALGLLNKVSCPVASITIRPGDMMIFYTDGVTDRRRGDEFFGVDRLKRAAGALIGYPATTVAARLRATAQEFSSDPPRDDMAILVLRVED